MSRRLMTRIHGATAQPRPEARLTLTARFDTQGNPIPATGRTFELVAYGGGRMRPLYWGDDVVIDLAGIAVPDTPVPVIVDHQARPEFVIGSTSKITVAGGRVAATGNITAVGEPALAAIDLADAGHQLQCSIGADELVTSYVERGTMVSVNGQQHHGPRVVVSKCVIREITATVIGADAGTSFHVTGQKPESSVDARGGALPLLATATPGSVPMEPRTTAANTPADPNATPSTPIAATTQPATATAPTVPATPVATVPDYIQARRQAEAAESTRISSIRQICAARPGSDPAALNAIEAQAINEGWSRDQTELAVLRASRPTVAPMRQMEAAATGRRALEAALCLRAGVPARILEADYGRETLDRAMSREMRSMASFSGLFNQVLMAAGQPVHFGAFDNDAIRATFEADRMLRASGGGGVSTYSLTGILSNVANKALLAAYLAIDDSPLRVFGKDSTNNFKAVSRYRMTAVGDFDEVAKDGEIKDGTVSDETFTNQLKTYGRKIGISRQDIINDDLGAFTQIGQHFGRKAKIRVHKLAFGVLLTNANNFFHADHLNLSTGAGSALSVAGLTAAEQLFMQQKDAAGDPVMIRPKYLLVAPANAVTARQLYTDQTVNETTTTDKPKPNSNPHRGSYEPLVSPWMATGSGLTGALNAKWFLMADPADVAAVTIIYLNGNENPVIESSDLDFDVLGVGFRGYIDVGAAQADFRGGVQSNGS